MPTHQQQTEKECFYFVTFTCYQWKPLIEVTQLYDYLEDWIDQLKKRHVCTSAFVFMPNHIHLLVYVKDESRDLNHVLGEGKRFMAYEIVKRLKKLKANSILKELSNGVQEKERLKGKKHQVFRLSFDAKKVEGESILSVMDYIHHNPVSGKWNLAKDYVSFPHSSASYYEGEGECIGGLVDFRVVCSESSTE